MGKAIRFSHAIQATRRKGTEVLCTIRDHPELRQSGMSTDVGTSCELNCVVSCFFPLRFSSRHVHFPLGCLLRFMTLWTPFQRRCYLFSMQNADTVSRCSSLRHVDASFGQTRYHIGTVRYGTERARTYSEQLQTRWHTTGACTKFLVFPSLPKNTE